MSLNFINVTIALPFPNSLPLETAKVKNLKEIATTLGVDLAVCAHRRTGYL